MNSFTNHKIKYKDAINWAFILLMFGTAWQHFFWNTPYLAFLWSEDFLAPILQLFNMNWDSLVSNPRTEVVSEWVSYGIGIIFLTSTIPFLSKRKFSGANYLIKIASILFCIFILIEWQVDAFFLPHLFENSARIATVLAILLWFSKMEIRQQLIFIKITLALTFTFHGLFALNIFPLPGSFIDMTILILRVNENEARMFLAVVGVLDILFSFGLFIRKTERTAFVYMIIWGFLTALARIIAHFSFELILIQLHRWTFEFLIRTPHFLLPFAGILMRNQYVKPINGNNTIRSHTSA